MDFLHRQNFSVTSRSKKIVRAQTNAQDTIVHRKERKQLAWYGHVMEIGERRWPKTIINYSPTNKRTRG